MKVTSTRWGDITEGDDCVHYPKEHPYVVCSDAVLKAGNLMECLRWRHQCELVYKCVELDHLPIDERVNQLAVHVMAMAIHGGWPEYFARASDFDELYKLTGGQPPTAAEEAERVMMFAEAQSLADEWKKSDRERRKECRKKKKLDGQIRRAWDETQEEDQTEED